MKKYIVKIRAYDNETIIQCGTAIVVKNGYAVITAEHVACGTRHTVLVSQGENEYEVKAEISKKNKVAVLLTLQEPLLCSSADIFSDQEILDSETTWTVEGFITDEQRVHEASGVGIVRQNYSEDIWDCELSQLYLGSSNNYRGLSGSPVFVCDRIVGILQMHRALENGKLGIKMSSVDTFMELLDKEDFKQNAYELKILQVSQRQARQHIEQNKESSKYIPDVFVEEGEYKEMLRYFVEPRLFLRKALEECCRIDFSIQNCSLAAMGRPAIDMSEIKFVDFDMEINDIAIRLYIFLQKTIDNLEALRNYVREGDMSHEEYYAITEGCHNSLLHVIKDIADKIKMININYVLLTKHAGQGKTNLLCDFTENFLLKKNFCVFYYNAYEFRESPMVYLKRELCVCEQYEFDYVKKVLRQYWKRTGKPIVLVIDGLNENNNILDFGRCIQEFLTECAALPFLKIIMTTREELLQERFGVLLKTTDQDKFLHLPICTYSSYFSRRIFEGYLNFFDVHIRLDTLTDTVYKVLTEDLLLLRFFCEVKKGERCVPVYNIYKYDLFQLYLKRKAQEYKNTEYLDSTELFYELIDHICQKMLNTKTYFELPLDGFSSDEQKLMKKMLENEVIFKGEAEVSQGILSQKKTVVSFTFDEFRDFCITNYLLKQSESKEIFLEFWDHLHETRSVICEGVERYTFFLAFTNTKYQDNLLLWLRECAEYEKLYWNNVWDIEDKYLTKADLTIWKEQILNKGPYAYKVISQLLFRYDRSYFTNINIQTLFDVMDELMKDIEKYMGFVQWAFKPIEKNVYGVVMSGYGKKYSYNYLLEELFGLLKNNKEICKEWLLLTIYLYELSYDKTNVLWNLLFSKEPEKINLLLKEMNEHPRSLVKRNVRDILEYLVENNQGSAYSSELTEIYEKNDYNDDFSEIFNQLEAIFNLR